MNFLFLDSAQENNTDASKKHYFAHELSRHVARRGHRTTYLQPHNDARPDTEVQDSVTVIRRGNRNRFTNTARQFVSTHGADPSTIIVDHITPTAQSVAHRLTTGPRVLLVTRTVLHDLAWHHLRQLRHYKHDLIVTDSLANKKTLEGLGHTKVVALPPGVHAKSSEPIPRTIKPTWLYHGPLDETSNVDEVITAFAQSLAAHPASTLWLTGNGSASYIKRLKDHAQALGVNNVIRWFGRVPWIKLQELFPAAWALIMTTTATEYHHHIPQANLYATPAIVYNLPDLADMVEHNKTGYVSLASPASLAQYMDRLARLPHNRAVLGRNAQFFAAHFNWDTTTDRFLSAVDSSL